MSKCLKMSESAPASPGCRLCELEEVVDGADHRPLGSDLIKASQQELPEASGVLDLPEHGFDHLLPEPVAASAAGALQPLSHGAHQRAPGQRASARSMGLPMPRSPRRQVALDPPLLQDGQVGFRVKAC